MIDETDTPEDVSSDEDAPSSAGGSAEAEAAEAAPAPAEPTLKAHAESHDATGADPKEAAAKEEIFEALDHLKSAAGILFNRARSSKEVATAKEQAGRIAKNLGDAAEPLTREAERVAKDLGDAAEPIAKQLTSELGRFTRDVMGVVGDGARELTKKRERRPGSSAEEEE